MACIQLPKPPAYYVAINFMHAEFCGKKMQQYRTLKLYFVTLQRR